ncbi:hypothetical protein GCM10011505_20860 [Tistrella bauzanensis]|uniref:Flagellar hook-length control protein-like C-terminal domain-containing protein n=2 Tax=Tistrella bauzanensis TaxID=657419 RepID=A0ABQ1II71_9PROT|nr:hypothetical protein GCM10011505_20860 [Tistrella bauzanensis]
MSSADDDLASLDDATRLVDRTRQLIMAEAEGTYVAAGSDDDAPARAASGHGPEAARLSAIVVGKDAAGRMMVSTSIGLLSLDHVDVSGPPLAPGTRLSLVVTPETPRPGAATAGAAPPVTMPGDPLAPADWRSLAQAAQLVAALHPAAAERLLSPVAPTPGRDFAAHLMVLMKQVLSGTRPDAVDDLADNLERLGAAETARGVVSEFDSAAQGAAPVVAGEWRSIQVPSWANATVIPVHLHVQQSSRDGGNREEDTGGGTGDICRFIVETRLSRLGALQLDGLAAPGRIDMVLRSARPLPAGTAEALAGVMGDVLAVAGLQGGLVVRTEPPAPVPQRRAPRRDVGGVVA